jgi:hypothetical protein
MLDSGINDSTEAQVMLIITRRLSVVDVLGSVDQISELRKSKKDIVRIYRAPNTTSNVCTGALDPCCELRALAPIDARQRSILVDALLRSNWNPNCFDNNRLLYWWYIKLGP